jgi:2-dehydro-3-deoxy-D-arabinonate dehydratase
MLLTKHQSTDGTRWAIDGMFLPPGLNLSALLELPAAAMFTVLKEAARLEQAAGKTLAPIDPYQEVWAAGVTYLRSRDARKAESTVADLYQKVYEAERPELFFKSLGWRVAGNGEPIRIRKDSRWNVPEPELVLVINRQREIVGYCAGNDVSSRDIEGENPLYLPQAKVYDGACALGQGIWVCPASEITDIQIELVIKRDGATLFEGKANTSMMKRSFAELVEFLTRELTFPHGAFLMTGTCLVPGNDFTLHADDIVSARVGRAQIENHVRV